MPGLPVLVLSQYVEQLYARGLLAQGTGGVGYLLKDRVSDVTQFVDAIRRVAAGAAIAARIFTTDNAVGNTPTGELAARVIGVSGPAGGPQRITPIHGSGLNLLLRMRLTPSSCRIQRMRSADLAAVRRERTSGSSSAWPAASASAVDTSSAAHRT